MTNTELPLLGSLLVIFFSIAFVALTIWVAVQIDHPVAALLPVAATAAFAGAAWYGFRGVRGSRRRSAMLERLEREGIEVEGRILRSFENVGGVTCTVEAEAEIDGRRLSFQEDSLSSSLIRTTSDGISLRPGSAIRIRYLPQNPRIFAFVAASQPTPEEIESEARDLRLGALGFLVLFGGGGLVMLWTTGESQWFFAAGLGFGASLLIWLKSRYVAS